MSRVWSSKNFRNRFDMALSN